MALFTRQSGESVEASVTLHKSNVTTSQLVPVAAGRRLELRAVAAYGTLDPSSPGIPRAPSAPGRP